MYDFRYSLHVRILSIIKTRLMSRFGGVETVIMGDVTYGACCVDDFTALALDCDLMVHYGHSCLGTSCLPFETNNRVVPVNVTKIPCLYVFVEIRMDVQHFIESVIYNFAEKNSDTAVEEKRKHIEMELENLGLQETPKRKIAFAATIQFISSLHGARSDLSKYFEVVIPQAKPLSGGELLGCTAPKLDKDIELIMYGF